MLDSRRRKGDLALYRRPSPTIPRPVTQRAEVDAVQISPQAVQIDDQQPVNVNRPMSQQE